jgi:hypothetical protein
MDPYQSPSDNNDMRRGDDKNSGHLFFAVGFIIFWLGGLGSCTGLGQDALKIEYPFVVSLGLFFQCLGMIKFLKLKARSGCLAFFIVVSVLASFLWAIFSLFVVFNGFH